MVHQVTNSPAFPVQSRQVVSDQGDHIRISQPGFQGEPFRSVGFFTCRFMASYILVPFRYPALSLDKGFDIRSLSFGAVFVVIVASIGLANIA